MNDTPELPLDIRRLLRWGGGAVAGFVAFAVAWSMLAQITTTIRVPGVLSPSAPTYEVQHETGGRIAALHVSLHEEVEAGDLLFQLDVTDELVQLDALRARELMLTAELAQIAPRLGIEAKSGPDVETVSLAYDARDTAFEIQLAKLEAEETASEERKLLLEQRLVAQQALQDTAAARFARASDLSQKGLLPVAELEAITREMHENEKAMLQLAAEQLQEVQRHDEITLARAQITEERREQLAATRLGHERELIETQARIARLEATVRMADIHAPVAGKVTELALGTEGVVAGAGMTLAVITQPNDEHEIDLYVPPAYRDQVRTGQTGLLTINALPQRDAPTLHVTLTDLALEPVRDADGNSLHYRARGVVDVADIEAARAKLGSRFQLSVGMPVSAAMNGRDTTLWSFVTGPFTGLLGAAFED